MRARLAFALWLLPLGACGFLHVPDQEARSRRIQTMAFGEMIIPDSQFITYHATPDEQLQRWLYRLTPEQSAALSRRCIRSFPVTSGDAYTLDPTPTVGGCLVWERAEGRSLMTIAVTDTRFEIYNYGRGEDLPGAPAGASQAQ